MKKTIFIFTLFMMIFTITACENTTSSNQPMENSNETTQTENSPDTIINSSESNELSNEIDEQNILVAYFSRADENYGVGTIKMGNTYIVADMIAENNGGTLFEIKRIEPYPTSYDECTDEAKKEQNEKARPELLANVDNFEDYDVIFLGYPIWWGDMPMPVYTFLESYDFSGKKIIPFCTHAGSGLSSTEQSIQNECPTAILLGGFDIKGETAQNDRDTTSIAVQEWLDKLNLGK